MINKIHNQNIYNNVEQKKNVERTLEFNKILENIEGKNSLKISSHAADRLKESNISLTDADLNELNSATNKLRDKGGREALILYSNIVFVTSVKNNTIITAMNKDRVKDNIFTNIDSAIIL